MSPVPVPPSDLERARSQEATPLENLTPSALPSADRLSVAVDTRFRGAKRGANSDRHSAVSSNVQPRIRAAQRLTGRRSATSGNGRIVTGGQGVAGSNPAVPTGRRPERYPRRLRRSQKGEPKLLGPRLWLLLRCAVGTARTRSTSMHPRNAGSARPR